MKRIVRVEVDIPDGTDKETQESIISSVRHSINNSAAFNARIINGYYDVKVNINVQNLYPCNFADAGIVGAEATSDFCYRHQVFCLDGEGPESATKAAREYERCFDENTAKENA